MVYPKSTFISTVTCSQHCWHHISNTNVHSPTLYPMGTQKPSYLHSSPKCWYIQYQHIFSTGTCSQNCWQHISNTTMYSYKCSLPNHVPDGHTETPLTYIHPPNVCMVYPISTYIFNCHMLPKLLLWTFIKIYSCI